MSWLLVNPRNQSANTGTGSRLSTSAATNAIANPSTIATEATKPTRSASTTLVPRCAVRSNVRSCPSFTGGPPYSVKLARWTPRRQYVSDAFEALDVEYEDGCPADLHFDGVRQKELTWLHHGGYG